jgi:hypothetical protein
VTSIALYINSCCAGGGNRKTTFPEHRKRIAVTFRFKASTLQKEERMFGLFNGPRAVPSKLTAFDGKAMVAQKLNKQLPVVAVSPHKKFTRHTYPTMPSGIQQCIGSFMGLVSMFASTQWCFRMEIYRKYQDPDDPFIKTFQRWVRDALKLQLSSSRNCYIGTFTKEFVWKNFVEVRDAFVNFY